MLPVNKLIILIIVIIVLIAIILILAKTTGAGMDLGKQAELYQCCNIYRANKCPDNYAAIICNDEYSLLDLANNALGEGHTSEQLKSFCDCK